MYSWSEDEAKCYIVRGNLGVVAVLVWLCGLLYRVRCICVSDKKAYIGGASFEKQLWRIFFMGVVIFRFFFTFL